MVVCGGCVCVMVGVVWWWLCVCEWWCEWWLCVCMVVVSVW